MTSVRTLSLTAIADYVTAEAEAEWGPDFDIDFTQYVDSLQDLKMDDPRGYMYCNVLVEKIADKGRYGKYPCRVHYASLNYKEVVEGKPRSVVFYEIYSTLNDRLPNVWVKEVMPNLFWIPIMMKTELFTNSEGKQFSYYKTGICAVNKIKHREVLVEVKKNILEWKAEQAKAAEAKRGLSIETSDIVKSSNCKKHDKSAKPSAAEPTETDFLDDI